ncbi:transposase [Streptomyces anthocyanicus]
MRPRTRPQPFATSPTVPFPGPPGTPGHHASLGRKATQNRGSETATQRLGRHRWTVERTVAWLAGCRRLHRRYERKAEHFLAFAGIAAALICFRRLGRVTGSHGAEKARVSSIELSA